MSNVRVFKFKEKEYLTLDFGNVKFEVDTVDQDFINNLKSFGLKLKDMGSSEYYREDSDLESIDLDKMYKQNIEVCNLYVEGIDSLLGENATSKIFGSKEITLEDIAEVGFWIISEINDFSLEKSEKKKKEILDKYSPQRIKK